MKRKNSLRRKKVKWADRAGSALPGGGEEEGCRGFYQERQGEMLLDFGLGPSVGWSSSFLFVVSAIFVV